jgi:CrcB protein
VAAGGALGSCARYAIALAAARRLGIAFPYGTFFVNVTGSFLLGFIATLVAMRAIPHADAVRLVVGVGFLGGYTTFSTYEFESNALLADGQWLFAAVNIIGSVVAGLVAIRLGVLLGKAWQ